MEPEVETFEEFEILWDPKGHHVSFEVYVDETKYVQGFVKWDGCTELVFGNIHMCGGQDVAAHLKLIEHLYNHAFEFMTSCQVDDPIPVFVCTKMETK